MLRNPCDRTADPLVKTKLTEYILLRRIGQCLAVGIPHTVNSDRVSEGWICLVPRFLGIPVVAVVQTVDNRIKGRVNAPSFKNVFCFGVVLETDGISVRTCGRNQEVQRLRSGITGALCENIDQASIRLRMQLIQNQTGNVQTVFRADLRRQHLIESGIAVIYQTLGRCHDLGAFQESRCHFHHALGNIEYNGCLLTVGCCAVNLGGRLVVGIQKIQRNRCRKL